MSYGPLPVSKSARTTSRDISLKPSAVPPPTQNLTTRLVMLVTTATKATRATPPALEDLAATPIAQTAHEVEMVLVVATATPTMLIAAHGGDWQQTIPRRHLLDLPGPALLSHQQRPLHRSWLPQLQCLQLDRPFMDTKRMPAQMTAARRACSHPRGRVLVPNDMRAPCPHRSLKKPP